MGHSPFIWGGIYAKSLRSQLNINDVYYILEGTVDPTVSAQNAPRGSIYFRTGGSGGSAYLKQDNGSSTNWTIIATGSGSSTSLVRMTLSGGVAPWSTIDGYHRVTSTVTLTTLSITLADSSSSGTVVIGVIKNGVQATTATLTATGGISSTRTTSLSVALVSGDVVSIDVVSCDASGDDLSVEIEGI